MQTIDIVTGSWTKIGDDVVSITFQSASSYGMYIAYTATDVAPTDDIGILYTYTRGELKEAVSDLTHIVGASYVWAKAVSGTGGQVIVEV